MEHKISIIVPIYNAQQTLDKCLKSIINQTYKNLEIILVNDGSYDSSHEICVKYQAQDKRIKYISQKNSGVACARNTGLSQVTGDYIGFVDSDDFIELNMFEVMIHNLLRSETDIVICGYFINKFDKDIKRVVPKNEIVTQKEVIKLLIEDKVIRNFLWSMLYKKDLFQEVIFPEKYIYEDVAVIYQLFLKANKISLVDQAMYHYVYGAKSITRNVNIDKNYILLDMLTKQRNSINAVFPDLYEACLLHEIRFIHGWLNSARFNKSKNLKDIKTIYDEHIQLYLSIDTNRLAEKEKELKKYKYNKLDYYSYFIKEKIKNNALLMRLISTLQLT